MKVAIIGTGNRATNLYIPIIKKIKNLDLIGLYGRNSNKTLSLTKELGVTKYESVEKVLHDENLDFVIVCVSWTENAYIYNLVANSDLPAILETPLAHDFSNATVVFKALSKRTAYTDIAEQYHLRPIEYLKGKMISSGIFGEIFYAFSDGVGHEYHGISLIRSYIGFHQKLKRIVAIQKDAPIFDHKRHRNVFFPGERMQHALLEFKSGAQAAYHWSWLSYESPIRLRRISGFHGTLGGCWGEECVVYIDREEMPERISFERRTKVIKGLEVLVEVIAFLDNKKIASWNNPFPDIHLSNEEIVGSVFINNIINGIKYQKNPIYPVEQAYEDHKIVDAMYKSISSGNIWKSSKIE